MPKNYIKKNLYLNIKDFIFVLQGIHFFNKPICMQQQKQQQQQNKITFFILKQQVLYYTMCVQSSLDALCLPFYKFNTHTMCIQPSVYIYLCLSLKSKPPSFTLPIFTVLNVIMYICRQSMNVPTNTAVYFQRGKEQKLQPEPLLFCLENAHYNVQ